MGLIVVVIVLLKSLAKMFPADRNDRDFPRTFYDDPNATPLYEPDPPVTTQPQNVSDSHISGPRRPIPVSTVDWQSIRANQFIPRNGLDFLDGVDKLYIQQTVELLELLANVDSEKRYTIKVPQGETLYHASESSTNFQRFCFGSNRAFVMRLVDQTQQEALQFRRRLAFGNCSCWCYLQGLEIWVPPGEMIGHVQQQTSLSTPILFVYNERGDLTYCIEGPESMCSCINNGKDKHFKIYNAEATTQLGSINHQWDQVQADYVLCLQFPNRNVDAKTKALLLGTAFLLEYMYFERSKMTGCLRCSC